MVPFEGLRGPLVLEELEERVAPVVFTVQPGENLVYDLGGGEVGVLRNTGVVDLRVDITDTGGGAADVIAEVEFAGDGGAFRVSSSVGSVNDDYNDVPQSYDLGNVLTEQAIAMLPGAIIAGETLDAALPAFPFVSGTSTGGIGSVDIGGDLTGNLNAGAGDIGTVTIGGGIVGPVTITSGGTLGDVNVTGAVNAAGGAVNINAVTSAGNLSFGGLTSGTLNITSPVVGDVTFTADVTGSLAVNAPTGIGAVDVTGSLNAGAGAISFTTGGNLTSFNVTDDVLGSVTVTVVGKVPGGITLGDNPADVVTGSGGFFIGDETPTLAVAGTVTASGGNLTFQADDVNTVSFGNLVTTAGTTLTIDLDDVGDFTTGTLDATAGGTINVNVDTASTVTMGAVIGGTVNNNTPSGFATQIVAPGEYFLYDLGGGNVGAFQNTGTGNVELVYTDTGGGAADVIHRVTVLADGGGGTISGPGGDLTDLADSFDSAGLVTGAVINVPGGATIAGDIVDGGGPATPFTADTATGAVTDVDLGGNLTGTISGGGGALGPVNLEADVTGNVSLLGATIGDVLIGGAVNSGVGIFRIQATTTIGDVLIGGNVSRSLILDAPVSIGTVQLGGNLDSSLGASNLTTAALAGLSIAGDVLGDVAVTVTGNVPGGVLIGGQFSGNGGITIGGTTPSFEIGGNVSAFGLAGDALLFEVTNSLGTSVTFAGAIGGQVTVTFDDVGTAVFAGGLSATAPDTLTININTATSVVLGGSIIGNVVLNIPAPVFPVAPDEYFIYDLGAGLTGVLYNDGLVTVNLSVINTGGGLADVITQLVFLGDGGSIQASGPVGTVSDGAFAYDLAGVVTGAAIDVPGGATIAASLRDAGVPALPFTSSAVAGGVTSVNIDGDLIGDIAGGGGAVGTVVIGGNVIGPATISGLTVGAVDIAGDVTGTFIITSTTATDNVVFHGTVDADTGSVRVLSTAGTVGDVTFLDTVLGPVAVSGATAVGDLLFASDLTGPLWVRSPAGSIGDIDVLGTFTGGAYISALFDVGDVTFWGPVLSDPLAISASSTFDTDADGWTVSADGTGAWVAAGGNPGGFFQITDGNTGDPETQTHAVAPATFLGDWTALNGAGLLTFDLTHNAGSGATPLVLLSGPGGSATYSAAVAAPWTTYTVVLNEALWTVTSGTWDALLADVTSFMIDVDYTTNDVAGIDNVALNANVVTIRAGRDLGSVASGADWTGGLAVTAGRDAGSFTVDGDYDADGGPATIAVTRDMGDLLILGDVVAGLNVSAGRDMASALVDGDVLAGFGLTVGQELFGGLVITGDYTASGANVIQIDTSPGVDFGGMILALDTSSFTLRVVNLTGPAEFGGPAVPSDIIGTVTIDLTNPGGEVDGDPLGADVTFWGTITAETGGTTDVIDLDIGSAVDQAAGIVTFYGDLNIGDGASFTVDVFAYICVAVGDVDTTTYNVTADSSSVGNIGSPGRPVIIGREYAPAGVRTLVATGSVYVDFYGESLTIIQGLRPGADGIYGTLDDEVVNPDPASDLGGVGGEIQAWGSVTIYAAGDVMTGITNQSYWILQDDGSGNMVPVRQSWGFREDYIQAGVDLTIFVLPAGATSWVTQVQPADPEGSIHISSMFGTVGRSDITLQAGHNISAVTYFGRQVADLSAGNDITYLAAGTLEGGDGLYGTADDWSIAALISGPDGLVGTVDDDWSWVDPSAMLRVIDAAGLDGVLGYDLVGYDPIGGIWVQDDSYGLLGRSDRGAPEWSTSWTATRILAMSAATEIRGLATATGAIGDLTDAVDNLHFTQDDVVQGIVSLHTISGTYGAGTDIYLIHARNLLGVVSDFGESPLIGAPVYTAITAGGTIYEVSVSGIPDPANPQVTLDGHLTARISAGGDIHLIAAGGDIYSADEYLHSSVAVADTEISAGGVIHFIICDGPHGILGAEPRAMPDGRVFTYTDNTGASQQLLVTRGSGVAFLAFGFITDLELDGNGIRVLSTGSIGEVSNSENIDYVIVGVDPGPDGILGTADDIRPFATNASGPDNFWGTTDDQDNVGNGNGSNASIFRVVSYNGNVNQVVALGRIAAVGAARDIGEVTSVNGTIGMTASVGYMGIGGVVGSDAYLILAGVTGAWGSVHAGRDIGTVQAVSTPAFSSSMGGIVGDVYAGRNINLVRANWYGEDVDIVAGNNITTVIKYTTLSGATWLSNVWVVAGVDSLNPLTVGNVTRVIAGTTDAGVRNPGDAHCAILVNSVINVWALNDIGLVRHTGRQFGWVDAGRDIGTVESLHGLGGILTSYISAGRDIGTIFSGAMIGSALTPALTDTVITAGRDIGTIFTRTNLGADIAAGRDIRVIETDAGFFHGSATAGRDIIRVEILGEDITAGDRLMADLTAGNRIGRVLAYTIEGDITTGGNLGVLRARGSSAGTGISVSGDLDIGGRLDDFFAVGHVTGDVLVGGAIRSFVIGTYNGSGTVVEVAHAFGTIEAGRAGTADIQRLETTGGIFGTVSASRDILTLIARSGIYGTVAARRNIVTITTGEMIGAVVSAGFDAGPDGLFGTADDVVTGLNGQVQRINIRPRADVTGGSGDILDTLVQATGLIGQTNLPAGGAGNMSGVFYSAGFGPGPDGILGTADDVVLRTASIGNIGTSARRFSAIDGWFQATGNIGSINSAGDLGAPGDLIWAINNVGNLRADDTLTASVVAGRNLSSLNAWRIDSPFIVAGFDPWTLAPTAVRGNIANINTQGGGIVGSTIASSGDVAYGTDGTIGRVNTTGGGAITGVVFSAGFGPGLDGVFGTDDDVVLRSGSIGNIGTSTRRFSAIDGWFQATRNVGSVNSSGKLGDPGDQIWGMNNVGNLRAGGVLGGTVAAGRSLSSIAAAAIAADLISAGYGPGPNGLFELGGDDVLTGLQGNIGTVTATAGGITGSFRAARNIGTIRSAGLLGTFGTDSIFAGGNINLLFSVDNLGAAVSAGTLTGRGVIGRIEVNEPNDFGGPDPTILDTVFANLSIDRVIVEAATDISALFTGVAPVRLTLDSDGDGF